MRSLRASWPAAALLLIGLLAACVPVTSTPAPAPTPPIEQLATEAPPLPSATPEPPPAPVTVRIAPGGRPATLDPQRAGASDMAAADLIDNLFAGLAAVDPATGQVVPSLAREWQQIDSTTWRVFMRDDVYWVSVSPESGELDRVRPITAHDVVFAVQRACRATYQGISQAPALLIRGCQEIARQSPDSLTEAFIEQTLGARVLNDTVIEFKLVSDQGAFLTALAMPLLRPLPADLIDSAGEDWSEPGTIWTSGPFALLPTTSPEEGYTLIANEFWPLPHPGNVSVVQLNLSLSEEAAFAAWEDGDLDLAAVPQRKALTASYGPGTSFRLLACPVTAFVVFSYDTAPFNEEGMRRALALTLDRAALVDGLIVGEGSCFMGMPASTLASPGTLGAAPPGKSGLIYDPDLARTLLAEAGHAGCGFLPEMTLLTDDTSPASEEIARRAVTMWAEELGCANRVRVETAPLFDLLATLQAIPTPPAEPRAGMIALSWQADLFDAQHWAADILGCREFFPGAYLNQLRPCSEVDDLLQQAITTHDQTARAALYARLDDMLFGPAGEMPVIPLYHRARPLAVQPWLTIDTTQGGTLHFDRWVVDTEAQP